MTRAAKSLTLALSGFIASALSVPASGATLSASTHDFDPVKQYGSDILFDVLRNGSPVGFHRVKFSHDGDILHVQSRFELQIKMLFFTTYRFTYQADARWHQGQLLSLDAKVDDNGEKFSLRAEHGETGLDVMHTKDRYSLAQPIYPTNHWHPDVVRESKVLNTLTGRVNEVKIQPRGREPVTTENGEVLATRFVYAGDLQNEVWYDAAGRWVKMQFLGRDGSTIEYICKSCQGSRPGQALQ